MSISEGDCAGVALGHGSRTGSVGLSGEGCGVGGKSVRERPLRECTIKSNDPSTSPASSSCVQRLLAPKLWRGVV